MEKEDEENAYILFLKPSGRLYYLAIATTFIIASIFLFVLYYMKVFSFCDFAKLEFFSLIISIIIFIIAVLYFQTAYMKIEGDTITVRKGILIRKTTLIPLHRIDNIKTSSSIFDLILGLQTIMIDTSGTDQIEVIMPYIPKEKVIEFLAYFKRWKKEGKNES
jgi:putative membrane protein